MKSNDALLELIYSLNASEKRYLRLFASRQVKGEQNKYMQVFEALDAVPQNGNQELNQLLRDITGAKQVSRIKTYLKELILKSLIAYHSEGIIENKVREILSTVEVLTKKRLLEQASQQLDKAEKLAREHELFTMLLEIAHLRIRTQMDQPSAENARQLIQRGKADIQQGYAQFYKLWSYDAHALSLHVQTLQDGYNTKSLEFPEMPVQAPLSEAESIRARIKFHRIHSSYLIQQNKFEAAIIHLQAQVAVFEERPQILSYRRDSYLSTLRNLLLTCRLANQYPLAIETAQQLRAQLPRHYGTKLTQLNINTYIATTNSCLDLEKEIGDLTSTYPRLPEFDAAVKRFAANIEPMRRLTYCYLSGIICFLAEDFREAARRFYLLTAQPEGKIRSDLARYARLMLLLAHYSMNHLDVFENELRSTLRFLKQHGTSFQAETVIGDLFKAMLKHPRGSKALRKAQKQCLDRLREFDQDAYERMAIYYFDFRAYVESALSGERLVDLLKRKPNALPAAGKLEN